MKLELKHLVNYFQYDVKIKSTYWNKIGTVTYIYKDLKYQIGFICDDKIERYDIPENCKLILHRISDIYKEIEVDGEKFVPIDRITSKWSAKFGNVNKKVLMSFIDKLSEEKGYNLIPHWLFQDLIKWHFDIFNLIPNKLAVDINELKQ